MTSELYKYEYKVLDFLYDFAELGGAVGTHTLGNLPDNFMVKSMDIVVETTITSGGTPTIVIGEDGGGDADGYFTNIFGTPTAGTTIAGSGALITDYLHIVNSSKDGILVTIGTAALTAGAFRVIVAGYQS